MLTQSTSMQRKSFQLFLCGQNRAGTQVQVFALVLVLPLIDDECTLFHFLIEYKSSIVFLLIQNDFLMKKKFCTALLLKIFLIKEMNIDLRFTFLFESIQL